MTVSREQRGQLMHSSSNKSLAATEISTGISNWHRNVLVILVSHTEYHQTYISL